MDSRKIALISTIDIIALIAFGIGYAYTAFTVNDNNNTDVAYVTLTQTGTNGATPYHFTGTNTKYVQFDTFNYDDDQTFLYKVKDSKTMKVDNLTYTCAELGKITLKGTITNAANAGDYLNISIESSTGFDGTGSWIYFLTDGTEWSSTSPTSVTKVYAYKNTVSETSSWTTVDQLALNKSGNNYAEKTIYVWYGYLKSNEDVNGFLKDTTGPKKLQNASIVFKGADQTTAPTDHTTNLTDLERYHVIYNANGGTGADVDVISNSASYIIDSSVTFTAPANKSFIGWSEKKNGSTSDIIDTTQPITLTKNTTLYAIWN